MNIAIIIGISEYNNLNDLPGCKNDAECIQEIIQKSNKYDQILYISNQLASAQIKDKLTDFVSEHKNKEVSELVFYFTGHGEFWNEEFYYLLSDYAEDRRKQTTLQNNEIDTYIKAIGPKLVVKIVDACQSGKNYIKDANSLEKYFKKAGNKFKKCYFLNSSLNNQSSYQSDDISAFTSSFVRSIKEHGSNEIRYKDVIDYISDDFENEPSQTPYFVTQADFTEKFCSINQTLRDYLNNLSFEKTGLNEEEAAKLSIVDLVREQAKNYATKEEAILLVEELAEFIGSINCPQQLDDLFTLETNFLENYGWAINRDSIGKWLDENEHDYFAKSKRIQVKKNEDSNPFLSFQGPNFLIRPDDKDYKWVRDGFKSLVELPYYTIVFDMNSKFPNVDSYSARIVYFLSKKQIIYFYLISNYEERNWDEISLNKEAEWFYTEHSLTDKEDIQAGISNIFDKLTSKIEKDLRDIFKSKEE